MGNSKPLIWLMGLLLTAFVAGCGGSGGDSGGTTAQPGTASVSMTDAPACGFEEVNVTVSKVRIHQSDSADDKAVGWTDITLDPPRTINLLDLNDPTQAPKFALETLGETQLAAGHYTQLRLVLVSNNGSPPFANWVVRSGIPGEIALDTPSAVQSGIKLIHQFDVGSGQRVDLLLDFDACKSIVQTGSGKYKLKPVIKIIPFVRNGIEGFVDKALLVNNVTVSAQVNGAIVRATVPNTQTGEFFLAHLLAGTAVKYDVVITADGHATAVISGVPVPTTTSITAVSTSDAPIPVVTPPTLEASATHSISGTVTLDPPPPPFTDEPTVFVAAKQTLVGGPNVTVKSLPATLLTVNPGDPRGDYEYNLLTLPIGAPSLGTYGPLPIVFTRQPVPPSPDSVAGKYIVQASADGYITQLTPSPVDISTTNQTQNFTLTP